MLDAQEQLESFRMALNLLEREVKRRIQEAGGTMLPDDEIEMKLEPGRIVDVEPNHLVPLKEILTPGDLDLVFKDEHDEEVPEWVIPAHVDHVPAKWANLVKLNAMARKYGDRALEHVARAGIRSDPKVVVERK